MNQTETGPSGFTETTVDEERIAIRVMIGDVVGRYRKQVPPDRVQKATFEVNGGLLMALLLALLMLVCIIQRLATGDRLMSFTGEPDVRDIQFTLMLVIEFALGMVVWFLIATGEFSRTWLYRLTPAKPVWLFDEVEDADLVLLSGNPFIKRWLHKEILKIRRLTYTRLDEELDDDAAPLGTNGPADADLPGPFGDGHQHDVHDADAAHQQADGGDTAQNQGDHAHLLVLLLLPGVLLVHLEAACVGINHSLQKAADAGAGLDHVLAAAGLHDELLRCVAAQHPAGGVGQNDDIVDLAGGCAFTGKAGGIDPHHLKALPVELEHLAHGVRGVEEDLCRPVPQHTYLLVAPDVQHGQVPAGGQRQVVADAVLVAAVVNAGPSRPAHTP